MSCYEPFWRRCHFLVFSWLLVLPYEPALVARAIGAHLAYARPRAASSQIAPRAVFLIHSADDATLTTPLAGEQRLYTAVGNPKQQWIAPYGGHVGPITASQDEYKRHVLAFFATYLERSISMISPYLFAIIWRFQRSCQYFPRHAPRFLEEATARILLRRVGGGVSFPHRRLLDYFAGLDHAPPPSPPD